MDDITAWWVIGRPGQRYTVRENGDPGPLKSWLYLDAVHEPGDREPNQLVTTWDGAREMLRQAAVSVRRRQAAPRHHWAALAIYFDNPALLGLTALEDVRFLRQEGRQSHVHLLISVSPTRESPS